MEKVKIDDISINDIVYEKVFKLCRIKFKGVKKVTVEVLDGHLKGQKFKVPYSSILEKR